MTAADTTTATDTTTPDDRDLAATWEAYTATWGPVDDDARRDLLARSLAPECVYTDPLVQAVGHDELTAYMATFHAQVPGGRFVTEHFESHHGVCHTRWSMVDGADRRIGTGASFGEYGADGRLRRVTGFFEVPGS